MLRIGVQAILCGLFLCDALCRLPVVVTRAEVTFCSLVLSAR